MAQKKARHWRPNPKLTITEAYHIKQIGRARGYTDARVLAAYKRAGKVTKLRQGMKKRSNNPRSQMRIDSAAVVSEVFGVKPRIVLYIWSGRYWKDA